MKIFYYNIVKGQILRYIENGTLTFTCEELRLAQMEIIPRQRLVMFLGETYNINSQSQLVFRSGIGLLSVNYQYNLKGNSTHDQIDYLNFPLAIRVFPTKRTLFETGLLYHHLIKAKNTEMVDLRQKSNFYPDNVFKNAFGWLFAVHYNIWKKFHASAEYRFFKKSTLTNNIQKNNFNGFIIGIHFLILNPNKIGS